MGSKLPNDESEECRFSDRCSEPRSSSHSLLYRNEILDYLDPWAPDPLRITAKTAPGLTTVVAMDRGPDGALYVLELSDAPGFPTPGDGKVVRVKANGPAEDVLTGLSVPTGMVFGPNGALYVSNWGAADTPLGQILRFNVH
jgi:hypothetical protein